MKTGSRNAPNSSPPTTELPISGSLLMSTAAPKVPSPFTGRKVAPPAMNGQLAIQEGAVSSKALLLVTGTAVIQGVSH